MGSPVFCPWPGSPSDVNDNHTQGESQVRQVQSTARNIVIFGESGVGKSSLVNMLLDHGNDNIASVSNHAVGGTLGSSPYCMPIDGIQYTLWDTAGLNEGEHGSVPAAAALTRLYQLGRELGGGISLLVYCIRASRYRDIIKVNYEAFVRDICQGEIPVVIVITGLENEERMSDWWGVNKKEFTGRGMKFVGSACITTVKGRGGIFADKYEESRIAVRELIREHGPKVVASTVGSDDSSWGRRITAWGQVAWDYLTNSL